eukprot:scaffold97793_cov15-Tisochrysis_lutea.AAC.2
MSCTRPSDVSCSRDKFSRSGLNSQSRVKLLGQGSALRAGQSSQGYSFTGSGARSQGLSSI